MAFHVESYAVQSGTDWLGHLGREFQFCSFREYSISLGFVIGLWLAILHHLHRHPRRGQRYVRNLPFPALKSRQACIR